MTAVVLIFCAYIALAGVLMWLDHRSRATHHSAAPSVEPDRLYFCASCPPSCTGRHRGRNMIWDPVTGAWHCMACCHPESKRTVIR